MSARKTAVFILFFLLSIFPALPKDSSDSAMSSFMGARWGVNALDFKNAFAHSLKLKWVESFYLENFQLEDITFEKIDFVFYDNDGIKPKELKKKNAPLNFFREVIIDLRECNFDYFFEILVFKYGKPARVETDYRGTKNRVIWYNEGKTRIIIMNRNSGEKEISRILFVPYKEKFLTDKSQRIKKIAAHI